MNIWEQMEACKSEMTPKELKVYELIKKDPYPFTTSTTTELAARYNISQSSISRFCLKVGFSSFVEFRMHLGMDKTTYPSDAENSLSYNDYQNDVDYMLGIVRQTGQALPDSLLASLSERILNASNIYTSGYGSSDIASQTLAFMLTISGIPAHLMVPSHELETLRIIKSTDLVILFSAGNASHKDFLDLVTDLPVSKRPYIILVANTSSHPLRHKVSQVVVLPSWRSAPLAFSATMIQHVFCQLLNSAVSKVVQE